MLLEQYDDDELESVEYQDDIEAQNNLAHLIKEISNLGDLSGL